jgi:hypothetical protein
MVDSIRAGARPTIYLHIGCEKTGSTYIQAVMFQNREVLSNDGLVSPFDIFQSRNQMELTALFLESKYCQNVRRPENKEEFRNTIKEYIAENSGNDIYFSNEHLSSRLTSVLEVANLVGFLKSSGHRLVVVCYIREPLSWAKSSYKQYVKSGGDGSVRDFFENSEHCSPGIVRSIGYAKSLAAWYENTNVDKFLAIEYEAAKKESIVNSFLQAIERPNLAGALNLELEKSRMSNPSLTSWQLRLLRRINRTESVTGQALKRFIKKLYTKLAFGGPYKFSDDEMNVLNKFSEAQRSEIDAIFEKFLRIEK